MKNVYTLLLFILLMLFSTHKSVAQTDLQDSLSLVDLYNQANGTNWNDDTNWLTGTVDTWFGITITSGRVTSIELNDNNLSGSVPATLDSLDALKKLDVSENNISGLPSFVNLLALDSLNVSSNQLTFEDILPNISIADSLFVYAPQDSLENSADTAIYKGASISFILTQDTADWLGNTFSWQKNNSPVSGENGAQLDLNCVTLSDSGYYSAAITNADIPGLTLHRRKIHLSVINVIANAGLDATLCEDNYQVAANIPVTGTGQWTLISGSATIAAPSNPFSLITAIQPGSNIFRWTISNGSCANIAFDDMVIVRNSEPSVPNAGADKTLCFANDTLDAALPAVGSGLWSVISGQGVIENVLDRNSPVSNLSVGENIFRWQITNGICESVFDEVKIIRQLALDTAYAGTDNALCPTEDSLFALSPVTGSGWWSVISGTGNLSDANAPVTFVTGLSEGENTFRWTASNSCQLPIWDDVTITVYDFINADAGTDGDYFLSPFIEVNMGGDPTASGGSGIYNYFWTDISSEGFLSGDSLANPVYYPTDTGTFVFALHIEDSHGCVADDSVSLHIFKPETLTIPTLFTPNGDGNNDLFEIPGVESYPWNEITIIDKYGQVVYKAAPYVNEWDGMPRYGVANSSEVLPGDTYYYILKIGEGKEPLTGYVVIKK